eukprot:4507721-Prymnesium_polylepis.1
MAAVLAAIACGAEWLPGTGDRRRVLRPSDAVVDATVGSQLSADSVSTCSGWSGLPTSISDVPVLQCGVLVFVHIVKTGGTTVTDYLGAAQHQAGFKFFEVSHSRRTGPIRSYDYSKDPAWVNFKAHAYDTPKPKAAAVLHEGVPGIGDYMWENELAPMKKMLEDKGCQLIMTTTLHWSEY